MGKIRNGPASEIQLFVSILRQCHVLLITAFGGTGMGILAKIQHRIGNRLRFPGQSEIFCVTGFVLECRLLATSRLFVCDSLPVTDSIFIEGLAYSDYNSGGA